MIENIETTNKALRGCLLHSPPEIVIFHGKEDSTVNRLWRNSHT